MVQSIYLKLLSYTEPYVCIQYNHIRYLDLLEQISAGWSSDQNLQYLPTKFLTTAWKDLYETQVGSCFPYIACGF